MEMLHSFITEGEKNTWAINLFAVSIYGLMSFLLSCMTTTFLTHQGREHLTQEKERFAHEHPQMKKLEDVVRKLKPTAIIGSVNFPFEVEWLERCSRQSE